MTVLVLVLAADTVWALGCLKECFAVLIPPHGFIPWKDNLTVAVSEHALVFVAAETDFNPVFAQLCFVFSLKFCDHVTGVGRLGCFSGAIGHVDLLGWSFSWNEGSCGCVQCKH